MRIGKTHKVEVDLLNKSDVLITVEFLKSIGFLENDEGNYYMYPSMIGQDVVAVILPHDWTTYLILNGNSFLVFERIKYRDDLLVLLSYLSNAVSMQNGRAFDRLISIKKSLQKHFGKEVLNG